MTNLLLLTATSIGCIILSIMLCNWETIKHEYGSWPDRVKTVVVVVSCAIGIKVCMVLLSAVQ